MKLEQFRELNEVISQEHFFVLLNIFFIDKNLFESSEQVEVLEILSEKYSKFNSNILNVEQENKIKQILIELSDFANLERIEILIRILFNFQNNEYYDYLEKHKNSIIHSGVKKEVFEALEEYRDSFKI